MTRTFHFETITAAAAFMQEHEIPSPALTILRRNKSGIATYCEVSAPAEWF